MFKRTFTRRRLLQSLGMTAAAGLLTGCKTIPDIGGALGNGLNRVTSGRRNQVNHELNGLKPLSPEDRQAAMRAEHLLKPALRNQPVPLVASELAHPDRLLEVETEWERNLSRYEAKGYTNINDHLTMAMLSMPLVGQGLAQKANELPTPKAPSRQNGRLIVPPGTRVTLRLNGACMDDELPAPEVGEKLTLRPSSDYIAEPLQPVYGGLSEMYGRGEINKKDFQHLTWAIRNVDTPESVHIQKLETRHIEQLNRAAPGGHHTLISTHQRSTMNPLNDLGSELGNLLNDSFQVNLNGQRMGLMELFEQGGSERAVDALLGDIMQRPVTGSGRIPDDNSHLTMLGDSVAAMTTAHDRLDPEITLINAGMTPFVFNPANYIAESRRDTQRVALPTINGDVYLTYQPVGLAPNPHVNRVADNFLTDIATKFSLHPASTTSPDSDLITTPVAGLWSPAEAAGKLSGKLLHFLRTNPTGNFVGKAALDYVPLVSSLASLYEVIAGHHLLEPDNPSSPAERGLAALGIIPGVKYVIRASQLTGQSAPVIARELTRRASIMLEKFENSHVSKMIDKVDGAFSAQEALADLGWWNKPENVALLEEPEPSVRIEPRYRSDWEETINYAASL